MVDESVTVKGSPVRSLQKFVEAELTPEQRETLFRNISPEYAARFRTPILATETVPVRMLNAITEEAAKIKGEPVASFALRAGRQGASDAVKGVYRFFALVLTPAALISKASQMWSSIYNRGEMRLEEEKPKSAKVRLSNFPSEPVGCARITGWIEQLIALTGAKNVRAIHTECVTKGGKACQWNITWL